MAGGPKPLGPKSNLAMIGGSIIDDKSMPHRNTLLKKKTDL